VGAVGILVAECKVLECGWVVVVGRDLWSVEEFQNLVPLGVQEFNYLKKNSSLKVSIFESS
jgi:hypothetical protein